MMRGGAHIRETGSKLLFHAGRSCLPDEVGAYRQSYTILLAESTAKLRGAGLLPLLTAPFLCPTHPGR